MNKGIFGRRHGRTLLGAASALALLVAMGSGAEASTGCTALSGAVYNAVQTASFTVQLNGGANFTLDPGETIDITVNIPSFSTVQVITPAGTLTFDNSTGATPLSDSQRAIVPGGSGSVTGPITITGFVSGSGNVSVDFDCAEASPGGSSSSDAEQSAGQADTAIQGIIPGGIGGDVFGDFSIPFESPLNRTGIHDPNFRGPDPDCADRIAELQEEVRSARLAVEDSRDKVARRTADMAEVKANAERARQILAEAERARELARLVSDSARREAKDNPNNANLAARSKAVQAAVAAGWELKDARSAAEDAENELSEHQNSLARSQSSLEQNEANLAKAERALAEAEANCGDGSASLAPPPSSLLAFAPIVPDVSKLFAGFDLASERRAVEAAEGAAGRPEGLLGDERFNVWVNGGITFHRDRNAAAQEGETVSFGTGASWRFTPDLNAGAAFRFARTDRDGPTGFTEADTWSVALFAQTKLVEEVMLNAIASYSRVDLDLGFGAGGVVTATGSTEAESWAGQLALTRSFTAGRWQVTPNLGASIVNFSRDGFTRSDAVAVPSSDSTQVSVSGGPTVSTTLSWVSPKGQPITVSPSFGLQAFANVGRFDSVAGASGRQTETDRIGISANAGIGADLGGGTTLGLGTSWAGIGADQQNVTLSAQLTIPLN